MKKNHFFIEKKEVESDNIVGLVYFTLVEAMAFGDDS